MSYFAFPDYVSVAQRRAQAAREVEKLRKKGRTVAPVVIEGRTIARNFWGKAWCENLERYSDFENRLPRGQSYVRNGSVIDLQIEKGQIRALVMGSSLYKVKIEIGSVSAARWRAICRDCGGSVGSLVELLSGKLSKNVMERVCRKDDGLFPAPDEIKMSCSCPDGALMCKHVAATLYGAGARLDATPDLLFALRGVDSSQLIANTGAGLPIAHSGGAGTRILADENLAALFGVEMAPAPIAPRPEHLKTKARAGKSTAGTTRKAEKSTAPRQPATKKTSAKCHADASSKVANTKLASERDVMKSAGVPTVKEKVEPDRGATAAPVRPANASAVSAQRKAPASQRRVRTKAARWIKRP